MYSLLVALGVSVVTFGAVALILSPITALVPALIALIATWFVLMRLISKRAEASLNLLVPLLQAQKVDEARQVLRGVQSDLGRWQFGLRGQIDGQLGMIEYMAMKWDAALPLLESGRFRNWAAQVCIACIHFRRSEHDEAWEVFEKAAATARKEVMVYLVWATLLSRSGNRTSALDVLNRGLKVVPDNGQLKGLRTTIANKKKIRTEQFPEMWMQFWPEDLVRQMQTRARKGQLPPGQMRQMTAPQPRMRGKMARRR